MGEEKTFRTIKMYVFPAEKDRAGELAETDSFLSEIYRPNYKPLPLLLANVQNT